MCEVKNRACLRVLGALAASLLVFDQLVSCSQLIPGPGAVVFNDGNETITVDFSDIEFYPVESFPLFTSVMPNASEGLKVPGTAWEKKLIRQLITAVDFDQVTAIKEGRIMSASDLPQMLSSPGHPAFQGTPDYLKAYGISSLGPATLLQKKFTTLAIEADFGQNNLRHYSMVRFQNRFNFGRKIARFAFWQSMNEDKPRHIWLTDATMWRGVSLKPLGRILTPGGWAIMWTY